MIRNSFFSVAVAILMSFCLSSSVHAAAPEEQLIEAVEVAFGSNGVRRQALPGIKWAPLPLKLNHQMSDN